MKAGIAGGGIMGQLLAFSLINAGWNVTLFDTDITNNCSQAAAGLLTPLAELEKNDLIIFQLGEESLTKHWPIILNRLERKIYFQKSGSLILSHPKDRADLNRFIQIISTKVNNDDCYQQLNKGEISQLEPDLSKFNSGYYFPNEGQIDNQTLLSTLQNYLIEREINLIKDTVVLEVRPGEIVTQKKYIFEKYKFGKYKFDWVLDCRGLGSKYMFNDLRGVRGELIWLHAPDISITRPIRFLHPRYSIYIVPRPNQIYLIGSSEIESTDFSNISVRTALELLTAIFYVNSNFSEARIIKTVTQCRPTLLNNLPKIKYTNGLICVNGLYRHGFLIAPTLAHDITQWIQQGKIERYPQLWEKYS